MKIKIIVILFALILSSCDYSHVDKMNDEQRLYLFDISDSSTQFISTGYNPIFLQKSNRIFFSKDFSQWMYNIDSGQMQELNINTAIYYDEYSFSPYEESLVFRSANNIVQINLSSLEIDTLVNSSQIIMSSPNPRYSNDGNQIIYTSCPNINTDRSNFDSVYVHIYDLRNENIVTLDTLFKKIYQVYFTQTSDNFYIVNNNLNNVAFYKNKPSPKLISEMKISNGKGYWSVFKETIITITDRNIYHYDLLTSHLVISYKYSRNLIPHLTQFIKNDKYIIGRDLQNIITIMDVQGNIIGNYKFDNGEDITGFNFSESLNKIIVETEVSHSD